MENHASMKKTKSKSIKKNIIIAVTLLFLFIIFSLSLMFYKITYDELINQLKSNLSELVKASKMTMENRIDGELKILETMARIDIIEDEKVSIEEKLEILKDRERENSYNIMAIVDNMGNAITTNGESFNIKDRDYFLQASTTGRGISEPLISRADGVMGVFLTVPIKSDTETVGYILAGLEGDILSSFVEDIRFGESGEAFMISKDGTLIAYKDRELVLNRHK